MTKSCTYSNIKSSHNCVSKWTRLHFSTNSFQKISGGPFPQTPQEVCFLLSPPSPPSLFLFFFFCSRPNFLDELARKRSLRRLSQDLLILSVSDWVYNVKHLVRLLVNLANLSLPFCDFLSYYFQILNLTQALRDKKSPLQLVQMPVVIVERKKVDAGDRLRSQSHAFTQSFQHRSPFFSWC